MVKLMSLSKPRPASSGLESAFVESSSLRDASPGFPGSAKADASRSLKYLAVKGKGEPLRPAGRGGLESIIGADERVRILDTDLSPWRMICALRIRGPSGAQLAGTGWLVGPRTLLTAGHCVHSLELMDGWAASIEVSPGRNGAETPYGTVTSTSFTSVDLWVQKQDPDFDIGCIHLAEPLGEKVGWFSLAALTPAELQGYLVNVSGYPADRGAGTEQWHHRNRVLRVTDRRVFYDVDTYGGQSGAPVWVYEREDSPPLAVAVHAYGVAASPTGLEANSAPRLLPEVLEQVRAWVEADGGWPKKG